MITQSLINNSLMPVGPDDSGLEILSIMDEYKVSHLPVVKGKLFLGLLSESDIFDFDNPEEAVGEHNPYFKKLYVRYNQHIFDVIKLMASEHLTLVPVVDSAANYLGLVTHADIIENFAKTTAVNQPGGIVVLILNNNDYVPSQISRILEDNDAKLLSLFVTSKPDTTELEVTIKVNRQDIAGILQTFERFGYNVSASFFDENKDDLLDRYNSLMNFLSI